MANNKQQLHTMILDRILAGLLPRRHEHDLSAGYGEGGRCVCCDLIIHKSQVQYDVELHSTSEPSSALSMHLDCYDTWASASVSVMRVLLRHGLPEPSPEEHVPRKRLFLIAYDYELLIVRAALLRSRGYEISSALGNEASQIALLATDQRYDLLIIGHAASDNLRTEMARWLRNHYPQTHILALNSTEREHLDDLRYNAADSAPDVWLPMAALAAGEHRVTT